MRSGRLWLGPLIGLVLASCMRRGPRAIELEMGEHFSRARGIHTAIIYGDLALTRESARVLAQRDDPGSLPQGSELRVAAMKAAARRLSRAGTLGDAALEAGALAESCATCHEVYGARPAIQAALPAPQGPGVGPHMARHRWALDRLWEGVIANDDEHWAAGVGALQEEALDAADIRERGGEGAVRLSTRLHELGIQAADTQGTGARATRFEEVLRVCVSCHVAARDWGRGGVQRDYLEP